MNIYETFDIDGVSVFAIGIRETDFLTSINISYSAEYSSKLYSRFEDAFAKNSNDSQWLVSKISDENGEIKAYIVSNGEVEIPAEAPLATIFQTVF
jgi:hypothetical protein